jgi:hypothetical protein
MPLQSEPISAEAIKNKFLGADLERYSLSMLMEYHNVNMKDSLEWATLKKYFTTQKYLQMFVKERHKLSDFNRSQLSYKFVTEVEYFLRNHQPVDHQKPLGNSGVMKHIERLRKMVNMAVRLEWLERDPFAKYRLRFDKVERDFLTKDELRMIEQREFSLNRLNWIRDLFIFSCHTGPGLYRCDAAQACQHRPWH